MKCKYEQEEKLLYTYETDIHPLKRSSDAFETGIKISPALNQDHFLFILDKFKIDLIGKNILNLGSGHGILDLLIAKNYNCEITAVEFSNKRIERCNYLKKKYGVKSVQFVHADINIYLDNLNNEYDIIMAFEVLEHLHKPSEVILKCKKYSSEVFFGTVPIQPNCKQKQHISSFDTIGQAKEILGCNVYDQSVIPLRLPECISFYYKQA